MLRTALYSLAGSGSPHKLRSRACETARLGRRRPRTHLATARDGAEPFLGLASVRSNVSTDLLCRGKRMHAVGAVQSQPKDNVVYSRLCEFLQCATAGVDGTSAHLLGPSRVGSGTQLENKSVQACCAEVDAAADTRAPFCSRRVAIALAFFVFRPDFRQQLLRPPYAARKSVRAYRATVCSYTDLDTLSAGPKPPSYLRRGTHLSVGSCIPQRPPRLQPGRYSPFRTTALRRNQPTPSEL